MLNKSNYFGNGSIIKESSSLISTSNDQGINTIIQKVTDEFCFHRIDYIQLSIINTDLECQKYQEERKRLYEELKNQLSQEQAKTLLSFDDAHCYGSASENMILYRHALEDGIEIAFDMIKAYLM